MTQDDRHIARVLFVNRLLKTNNQSFQQLFSIVMRAKHDQDFIEIRPQGRLGDGGNDGYLPADGHYFQVYGPIDPQEKVTEAAGKLNEDFGKLKATWHLTTPIRAYSFVFNDKYEGAFMKIAQALGELERVNPAIKCRPFTAAHLEDTFMSLPAERIRGIHGDMLPDPIRITQIDYGVLREVINYIMTSPSRSTPDRFGDLPELNEKIKLNKLCSPWGDLIRQGARRSGHVDNYFSRNSTFMKQTLRDHLVELYRQARDTGRSLAVIPDGISREDLIFDDFRKALLPVNANVAAEAAVDLLIGYYFEACDVFDPHADKSSPNASA